MAKTIGGIFLDPKDEARCRLDKNFTSKAHNWAQKYREAKSNPFDLVLCFYGSKNYLPPSNKEGGEMPACIANGGGA